ncbi:MAG: protein kinase [Planctomycetaceae bacterium]
MAIKLTVESFLNGLRQSGLVDADRLTGVLRELEQEEQDLTTSEAIANLLVEKSVLTRWQADKLLQGKFKGFLLGRYRLMKLLGRGEMSSVYLAEHVRMKRRCAIKVLPANKVKDTSYLGRFHREAEAVASLDHPNIVRAYDVDQESEAGTEIHFLVMEYVEGIDIENLLDREVEIPVQNAVDYIRQAAEGLAHAHENGLVHRDIKPGNLLVDKNGVVKLLDLGLARFFKSTEEESLTIKHDEKVLGTADYLAPEQAVDSHAVDERADIYSLGCTLYFALAGHPPFTDGTLVQRLLAHQTKMPPSISKSRPDVPESLTKILEKMMMKKREDRYQTAAETAAALSKWLVENGDVEWRRAHPALVAEHLKIKELSSEWKSGEQDDAKTETLESRIDELQAMVDESLSSENSASGVSTRSQSKNPSGPPENRSGSKGSSKRKKGRSPQPPRSSGGATSPVAKSPSEKTFSQPAAPASPSEPLIDYVAPVGSPFEAPPPQAIAPPQLVKTLTTKSKVPVGSRSWWAQMLTNPTVIVAALVVVAALIAAGVGYNLYAGSISEPERPATTSPEPTINADL